MMRTLAALLGLALVSGCGQQSEPAAPPAARPKPAHQAARRPTPPPAARQLPFTPAPPPAAPQPAPAPAPASAGKLATALQQYQAAANDPEQRSSLVTDVAALADEGAPKAQVAQTLGQMLQIEPTTDIKSDILNELGALGTPAAFGPISLALAPGQPADVRDAGVDAAESLLTDLGFLTEDPAAYDVLVGATDTKWPLDVRTTAISALQDRQDPRAIPLLQRLLNDPNPEIHDAASGALDWLQNQ